MFIYTNCENIIVPIKDPYDLSPDKTTYKIVSLPYWIRQWLREHKSINCSGVLQERTIQLIKDMDPEYYLMYKKYAEKAIRREENVISSKLKV